LERKHLTSGHFQQPLHKSFHREECDPEGSRQSRIKGTVCSQDNRRIKQELFFKPDSIRRKNFIRLILQKPGQYAANIIEGSKGDSCIDDPEGSKV
jgi:hypothetical protein